VKAFTVAFITLTVLMIDDRKDALSMDLTQFHWKNRLLFLFAPDGNNPLFRDLQSDILAQKAEVEDRDMLIFEVLERGPSRVNAAPIARQMAESIRGRFAIPRNTFALILVGKDGGVKLKRNDQTSLAEVFALIDSMPMRKNEMRRKNQ
jgi:hypothetical protein